MSTSRTALCLGTNCEKGEGDGANVISCVTQRGYASVTATERGTQTAVNEGCHSNSLASKTNSDVRTSDRGGSAVQYNILRQYRLAPLCSAATKLSTTPDQNESSGM